LEFRAFSGACSKFFSKSGRFRREDNQDHTSLQPRRTVPHPTVQTGLIIFQIHFTPYSRSTAEPFPVRSPGLKGPGLWRAWAYAE
jgi:hypothetical protein